MNVPVPQESRNSIDRLFAKRLTLTWEVAFYIVILVLAVFTRFYNLGDRVMSHDESLHTRFSYNLYNDGDFQHTPLMHGPILFHMVAFNYALFGDSDFSARIYPAFLGILMVLSPLLFRYWLGRWGAAVASLLLLISPLLLYYNRYIREDTPAIMAGILMIWAILMYLSGPQEQRRKPVWLTVLAFGMIWNLGTKETAFMYIAAIGILLALYWFVRVAQEVSAGRGRTFPGRQVFSMLALGILSGGVLALGAYCILDIIPFDLVMGVNGVDFATLAQNQRDSYFLWTMIAILLVVVLMIGTMLAGYRRRGVYPLPQLALMLGVMFAAAFALVVFEELSHTTNEAAAAEARTLSWMPLIANWVVCILTIAFFIVMRRRRDDVPADVYSGERGTGLWGFLDLFPEFDVMVIIGTLILPWAAALFPYMMRGTPADFTAIGDTWWLANLVRLLPNPANNGQNIWTSEQIGQVLLGFMSWLPLMATSIVIGLAWNWRRWLVVAGVFYSIFVFFFTTMFTNLFGLATGMYYSLGYWLEQQGVRRGSQPQYYYLLLIMPFYEFLPVIGSIFAMIAGLTVYWRRQSDTAALRDAIAERELSLALSAQARVTQDQDTYASDSMAEKFEGEEALVSHELTFDEYLEELPPDEDTDLVALRTQYRGLVHLENFPFLIFWAWIGVFNLILFTLAGEKMPWLGTHMAVPLIILSGWVLGRVLRRIEPHTFVQRGWFQLIIVTLFLITLLQVIGTLIAGDLPFRGLESAQLEATSNFLLSFTACVVSGIAVGVILWRYGAQNVRQLLVVALFSFLALITFRSAWMAAFINYDLATEFLVYAHSAPAVKTVLADIEKISLRTTDSMDLKFAYDNEVSWPYSWYFRHFKNQVYIGANPTVQNLQDAVVIVVGDANSSKVDPLVEDRYQKFQYVRMWWPMQDYFFLTADRVNNLLDISGTTNAAAIRKGMFDIWWNRDYTAYGAAVDKTFSLPNWPVQNAMQVYIRKDVAAQIWSYGTGDGSVVNPLDAIEQNVCNTNYVDMQPLQIINDQGNPLGRPLGMTFDADGNLVVAEETNHRISWYRPDGTLLRTTGTFGTATDSLQFNRPNSLTIAPDGSVYVVDTWNFRIQKLSADFASVVTQWGQSGTYGFDAPQQPTDAFWGPRDVKIDAKGRILVADTGNKRIRVYEVVDNFPVWVFDIGTGGSGAGQLDEPSGIAIHPVDGRVFVADTWNRRISVFTSEGEFLTSYDIRGWYQQLGNEPYLAIDPVRELLYTTDPDSGRVLVLTTAGDCVGSFATLAGDPIQPNQLAIAGGITLDAEGNVYVSDAGMGRILKFAPFPVNMQASLDGGMLENGAETTPEVLNIPAEITADPLLEGTPEATPAG